MASLRTAFIEAANPIHRPFCSVIAYLPSYGQQATSTDDIKKQRKTTISVQGQCQKKIQFLQPLYDFKNASYKTIHRFINMNINNFSHLLDQNSNDFKDCQNLVHILQLNEENEDQFRISQIDTIESIRESIECSTFDGRIKLSNGGLQSKDDENQYEDDFSEVEDFQR